MSDVVARFKSCISSYDASRGINSLTPKVAAFFAAEKAALPDVLIALSTASTKHELYVFPHVLELYFKHNIPALAVQFEPGRPVMYGATARDLAKIPKCIKDAMQTYWTLNYTDPDYELVNYRFGAVLEKMLTTPTWLCNLL